MRIPVKRTKKTSQNGNMEQISDQRCSFIHFPGEFESLDRNYESPSTYTIKRRVLAKGATLLICGHMCTKFYPTCTPHERTLTQIGRKL